MVGISTETTHLDPPYISHQLVLLLPVSPTLANMMIQSRFVQGKAEDDYSTYKLEAQCWELHSARHSLPAS